jgi:hypothetical protein
MQADPLRAELIEIVVTQTGLVGVTIKPLSFGRRSRQ